MFLILGQSVSIFFSHLQEGKLGLCGAFISLWMFRRHTYVMLTRLLYIFMAVVLTEFVLPHKWTHY